MLVFVVQIILKKFLIQIRVDLYHSKEKTYDNLVG